MLTLSKRIGSATLAGVVALGFAVRDASAQNPMFRVGQGQPAAGAGGVGGARPNTGVGFNFSGYGNPGGQGALVTSPYMATMSSSGAGNYNQGGIGGYGNFILPDPFSGYLRGSADVINAQGQYLVNSQQSFLLKEQVRAAQLDNRRRAFDEFLYERANTPTLNDQREMAIRDELRRSRNDPPLTEIWSAKALNDLLADAVKLQGKKVQGPNVPLDEELLKQINVSAGDGSGNFGLLKDGGNLQWPLALRSLERGQEVRDQLQTLVKKAYNETKDGKAVSVETYNEIDRSSKALHDLLVKNVGSVPFAQYSEAKGYLKQLDDAVKVLKRPGEAKNHINGDLTLKGGSVAEVVEFMNKRGLQFAPATGNAQAAYVALHRALAAYDTGANNLAAERDR
ncbi:MAG: hypothetical protein K2R98_19615 [Gemmataceae bacterium]|nr:hypothetical protein [Gemmataceae bacterium]